MIPSSFQLGSQIIRVKYDDTIVAQHNAAGMCDYQQNTITLVTADNPSFPVNPDRLLQIFWHEVSHFVLASMGQEELRDNEAFCDLLGDRLCQIVKSISYEKKGKK